MSRYLDPKADVVFKKIFHKPHLLKSFLNSVLPLSGKHKIASLKYLPSELVPRIPEFKYTVVDVRCTDLMGRIFVVEMQIDWTASFMKRMLFNASKAYVTQLEVGEKYHLLKPVYGLALLNSPFDKKSKEWYHHYKMVSVKNTEQEIKDLQLVFIELSKFKAKNLTEKKLQVLWLRFMLEINQKTRQVPKEFLDVEEIREAVSLTEESAYSKEELALYDKYWDAVSLEKSKLADSFAEGEAKGKAEGKTEGKAERDIEITKKMLLKGMKIPLIAEMTGLPIETVEALKKELAEKNDDSQN